VDSLAVVTHGQTQVLTRVTDVGSGVVTDVETLDVLSDGVDDTDGLVTGDERELGHELSLVDVLVGSANTTEGDYGVMEKKTGQKEGNRGKLRYSYEERFPARIGRTGLNRIETYPSRGSHRQ
jgi:hypothetical protein